MKTSIIIAAPLEVVWKILVDTHLWSSWGPSVNGVRCRDRFIQSGSKGNVRIALGIWIPFEITDFVPEKRWSWRVMNIRATGHRVEYLATKQCRLTFEVPWIAAPYLLICKIAARRIKLIAESR